MDKQCFYNDPLCPCPDGLACHYEHAGDTKAIPHPKHNHYRPLGECTYCDAHRSDPMMPCHVASKNCESGKRNHCTCDTCY